MRLQKDASQLSRSRQAVFNQVNFPRILLFLVVTDVYLLYFIKEVGKSP
uniref:Uncharacterized protein n=1 Tax=Nelumbo nucifera TaxID=4432 RepID=A0A822XR24_NELNU|nr:TPA_asm: hypothetical protein HUJ06_021391 [Nelumbo nucifera]